MPLIPPYQLGPLVLQIHRTVIPNVCEGSLNRVNRDFFGAYPQQHVSRSFDMDKGSISLLVITTGTTLFVAVAKVFVLFQNKEKLYRLTFIR